MDEKDTVFWKSASFSQKLDVQALKKKNEIFSAGLLRTYKIHFILC